MPDAIPHDPRIADLRVAIGNLAAQGKDAQEIRSIALLWNQHVAEPPLDAEQVDEQLNHVLLKLTPTERVKAAPVIPDDDLPPHEVADATAGLERDVEAEFTKDRADGVPTRARPSRNIIDWGRLAALKAPLREWILDQWLGYTPTLFAGRGGIGKTLLSQQVATCLATRRNVFRLPEHELRVLCWYCEDEHDELWRRQEDICAWLTMGLADLTANLVIDARKGLENTLYTTEYGRPMWTPLVAELEQQIGDYKPDVVMLDNIGHVYGANENDRHHVTAFVNGIAGLALGTKFCPMFIGHPAKDSKSEYAGNAAWENSVRMRWFMSDRLPDEPVPDDQEEQSDELLRFLCKRKSNYSRKDYIRFVLGDGVLKPEEQVFDARPPSVVDAMYDKRAEQTVIDGLRRINEMGKTSSDTKGANYLPMQLVQFGLTNGATKHELEHAMRRLMTTGSMKRAEVGKYPNRTPKFGLVEVS